MLDLSRRCSEQIQTQMLESDIMKEQTKVEFTLDRELQQQLTEQARIQQEETQKVQQSLKEMRHHNRQREQSSSSAGVKEEDSPRDRNHPKCRL